MSHKEPTHPLRLLWDCRMGYGARLLPDLPRGLYIKRIRTLYQLDCWCMMSSVYTDPIIIASILRPCLYTAPHSWPAHSHSSDGFICKYICLGTYERSSDVLLSGLSTRNR